MKMNRKIPISSSVYWPVVCSANCFWIATATTKWCAFSSLSIFFFLKSFFFPPSFAHFWRSLISFINNTWTPLALSDMFSPRHHFCFFFLRNFKFIAFILFFLPFYILNFYECVHKRNLPSYYYTYYATIFYLPPALLLPFFSYLAV